MNFSESEASEAWKWLDREGAKIEENEQWNEIIINLSQDGGLDKEQVLTFLGYIWEYDVYGEEHFREHYHSFLQFLLKMGENDLAMEIVGKEEVFLRTSWLILLRLKPRIVEESLSREENATRNLEMFAQAREFAERERQRGMDGKKRLSDWFAVMHETNWSSFNGWPPGVPGLRWKSVPDEPMEED